MSDNRELHVRSFPLAQLQEADHEGVMTGLVVPYGVPAEITEVRNGRPLSYREQFAAGAFERATRAPFRVPLVYNHADDFPNRLGHATSFKDSPDGLVGEFKLDPSRFEQARDALTSSHGGLSIGFVSIRPAAFTEREGQLVTRKSVAMMHVAAVAEPAYATAGVQSIRTADLDLGEPTAADIEADAQLRADRELLEFFAHAADRWSSLTR